MERINPVNLRLSEAGLDEIAAREGFVPFTYDDADPKPPTKKTPVTEANARMVDGRLTGPYGGTLTKGYGHTRTAKPGDRLTQTEARSLLRSDVRDAESCVHRYVRVPLHQGEFDGMTDVFYNVGPGSLPNAQYPNGKDGIACLGKSGGGRPSTLLTKLNEGDYEAAASCFTQWRMPGSVFEWGLLIRRICFMLIFMGLPVVRAMNAMPNVMPLGDAARLALVKRSIQLAREELEDRLAMQAPKPKPEATVTIIEDKPAEPEPAPQVQDPPRVSAEEGGDLQGARSSQSPPSVPSPEPDTLVLDKPLPPASATAPDSAEAGEAPQAPSSAASPTATAVTVETPATTVEATAGPSQTSVIVTEPEAKHPINSWTVWGGFALYFLPDLGPFAEKLLTVEIAGPIGHVIRGAALMVLIFGRVAASMPISIKAKAKLPALRKNP